MKLAKASLLFGAALAATTVSVIPTDALAQDAKPETNSRYAIEEVIVSARRVEEGLQEAPIAVTAITALELESRGALDIVDFADAAPNVSFQTNGAISGFGAAPRVSIRGVGQSEFVINSDPSVGVYADGVYLGRTLGSVLDLVDVERVEALRGPQGTLFGRNSIGGAVNIISKKPVVGAESTGYVNAAIGETGYTLLRGSANLPLGDDAAMRISAMKRDRDGFVPALQYDDLDLGAEDVLGLRAAFRWQPSDQLTIDLDGDYSTRSDSAATFIPVLFGDLGAGESDLDISGTGNQVRGPSSSVFARRYNLEPFAPPLSPNVAALGVVSTNPMCSDPAFRDTSLDCLGQAYAASRDGTNQGWFDASGNLIKPDDQSLEAYGVSGRVTYEGENFTINSISSWREFDSSFLNGSPAAIYVATNDNETFTQEQFSQEFTVNAAISDRLELLAGVFYQEETGTQTVVTVFPLAPPAGNNDPDFLPLNGIEDRIIDNSSTAIFGQLSFDITDSLALTAGARYTNDEKDVLIETQEDSFGVISSSITGNQDIKETNFLVNLAYQVSDDALVYGQFSDGFKNGGFPSRFPPGTTLSFEEVSFGPEFVDSIEVGLKVTLLDGALRANLALFRSDYTDQQLSGAIPDPGTGGTTTVIQNFGESQIQGFELEANYLVNDNFRVDMSLGYLDTELTAISALGGVSVQNDGTNLRREVTADDGIELPFAPELQLNVGANYSLYLRNGAELRNRIDVLYEAEQFASIANYDFGRVPSTTRVNYLLTYVSDAPWEIGIGARNLFDAEDISNAVLNTGPQAAGYHVLRRGREAFVQFKYNFDP